NPAFDATTFEVWGALLNGAKLVILSQSVVLDPDELVRSIRRHGVTVLFLTTGLFSQYADVLSSVTGQLRYVVTAGDVMDPAAVKRVTRQARPQHLLNGYGPTESTTFATTYAVEGISQDARVIPIGHPISNTQVYILNPQMQPVPIGVPGEIYIGGDGLALG